MNMGFFIRRSIQDCLAWSFKYIHQSHASKRPVILLKLDFSKAFDTIEHEAIIQILEHEGFDKRWVSWIKMILSSWSSSILLNGVPGIPFKCKKGVRQGDPLSPLLFVLVADLLRSAMNDLLTRGELSLPMPSNNLDFLVVQYADDTLMVLPAVDSQLTALKEMLVIFSKSTLLSHAWYPSMLMLKRLPS